MLHRIYRDYKKYKRGSIVRSSSVYRGLLTFNDWTPITTFGSEQVQNSLTYNQQIHQEGNKLNKRKKGENKGSRSRSISKERMKQSEIEIKINRKLEIPVDVEFYELVLQLEKLFYEMAFNELFEFPSTSQPTLLEVYLRGIEGTNVQFNSITNKGYLPNKYVKSFILNQPMKFRKHDRKNILQSYADKLNKIFRHQIDQRVDVDYLYYGILFGEKSDLIKQIEIERKNKQVPTANPNPMQLTDIQNKAKQYIANFKVGKQSYNVLIAQLLVTFKDTTKCYRIPLLGNKPCFDWSQILLDNAQKSQLVKAIYPNHPIKFGERHSELAMMADLFINYNHIVKELANYVQMNEQTEFVKVEIEFVSMKEVCSNCKCFLQLNHNEFVTRLQKGIKEIYQCFQVNTNLNLHKRALFMQYSEVDDEGQSRSSHSGKSQFKNMKSKSNESQADIPKAETLGFLKLEKFHVDCQVVKYDLKIYTGSMKQPFKNIQIIGTLYLSARNQVVQDFQDINANDDVVQHVKAEQVIQIDKSKRSIGSDLAVQQQQQQSCQEAELICNKIKSIIRNLRTKPNH